MVSFLKVEEAEAFTTGFWSEDDGGSTSEKAWLIREGDHPV